MELKSPARVPSAVENTTVPTLFGSKPARVAEDKHWNDEWLSICCWFQLYVQKRLQPVAAINPPAVFVFGSNSCGMNGWRTPIPAKMGQHPKQMSEPLSSVAPPKRYRFALLAATGHGRSDTEMKGDTCRAKCPNVTSLACFLNPNWAKYIDERSYLSPFRVFWFG